MIGGGHNAVSVDFSRYCVHRINDTLGHESGDLLIKGAAAVLQKAFRGNDIVARTGGDGFVILLRDMDYIGAEIALNRVRACVRTFNAEQPDPW